MINLLVIFFLFFFYKIIVYGNGQKIISGDGKVVLIFMNQELEKNILLLYNNNEVSCYIRNMYVAGEYKIYEINDTSNSITNVVAVKEKLALINTSLDFSKDVFINYLSYSFHY